MTVQTTLLRALPPVYLAAALRLAFPVLVLPVMAARLGAEDFGRLSLLLVWAGLLGMVVEGGFMAAATRLAVVADATGRWSLAQRVFAARVALSACVVLLAVAVVAWFERDGRWAEQVQHMVLLAGLACAIGWPATWYLQASAQLHRWARVEGVVYAAWLAAVLLLADSVAVYLLLHLAAASVLVVLGWSWVRRDLAVDRSRPQPGRARRLWHPANVKTGLRLGWTMMPVSIAGAAYSVALPAVASAQLSRADIGVYYLADRLVRTLLAAADPVFQLVYPRIVDRFRQGTQAAWRYTLRWAAVGTLAGGLLLLLAALLWQPLQPWFAPAHRSIAAADLRQVLAVLGWLLPLLLGWKFLGYWVLGSGRFDAAYRRSIVAGGLFGVGAAWLWAAGGPVVLARVALGAELVVIAVALAGVAWQRRRTAA